MKWLLILLVLTGCASAMPPSGDGPELVRVIVQTDRSVQLQHDNDAIEVASARGWPSLPMPVVVCVSLAGAPNTATPRVATLHDRTACP